MKTTGNVEHLNSQWDTPYGYIYCGKHILLQDWCTLTAYSATKTQEIPKSRNNTIGSIII